jgi:hypothetical protein
MQIFSFRIAAAIRGRRDRPEKKGMYKTPGLQGAGVILSSIRKSAGSG